MIRFVAERQWRQADQPFSFVILILFLLLLQELS